MALIDDVDSIFAFSMIGVVLPLFLLGLEMKPQLWVLCRLVFGLGSLQVVITTAVLGVQSGARHNSL